MVRAATTCCTHSFRAGASPVRGRTSDEPAMVALAVELEFAAETDADAAFAVAVAVAAESVGIAGSAHGSDDVANTDIHRSRWTAVVFPPSTSQNPFRFEFVHGDSFAVHSWPQAHEHPVVA